MSHALTRSARRARRARSIVATAAIVAVATFGLVPALLSAEPAAAAVPTPSSSESVVTVKAGGVRTGTQSVGALEGVVLHLQTSIGSTARPSGVRADGVAGDAPGWARCVADAQGDCSFVVPQTGGSNFRPQANRNARFWVVQEAAPAGYEAVRHVRTGDGVGDLNREQRYAFRTPNLFGGTVYSSVRDFMRNNGTSTGWGDRTDTASEGIWQNRMANPAMPESCGLDVALVMDFSGSVASQNATGALKDAADSIVDALTGTQSRMALYSFSSSTPADQAGPNQEGLTSVATPQAAGDFKSRYAEWVASGGTNWDVALYDAAQATGAPGSSNHYEVTIFLTDGNPTFYGPRVGAGGQNYPAGPGNYNRIREVENAMFSANALKSLGSRVLAFGVGPGVENDLAALNLAAISGGTAFDGQNVRDADFFQLPDYTQVGAAFADLMRQQCASSLSVTKMIVPEDNADGDLSGAATAGAGWEFTAEAHEAGSIVRAPGAATTVADGTGTVTFPLDFAPAQPASAIDLRETQQAGFARVGQTCTATDATGTRDVSVTPLDDDPARPGFTVDAAEGERVQCILYNRAGAPASLTVEKEWVVNGTTYAHGDQPEGLDARLVMAGPADAGPQEQEWGASRTDFAVGDSVGLAEGMFTAGLDLCTLVDATVLTVNGDRVDEPKPFVEGGLPTAPPYYAVELTQPENVVEVRNTVECTSELTLLKTVEGGDADPDLWTLAAQGPADALPGPVGTTGVRTEVTPETPYQLIETGGDPRYVQTDERTPSDVDTHPLSTGSMQCTTVDADGAPTSDVVAGLDGAVSVALGARMACTAVNQTASVTLLKKVVDPIDGGHTAGDWTLTADPDAGVDGLGLETVTGSEADQGDSTVHVRPGHVYTLGETGPAGYEATFQRLVSSDGQDVWQDVAAEFDVPALGHEVYRLVNERQPGSIAWGKTTDGRPLAGSVWEITGPALPEPLVIDDVDATGGFLVDGLDWGEYTVTETATPAGYVLGDEPLSFTAVIDGDDLYYVHAGALDNPQREILLPVAGGAGTWHFLVGGGALALLAIAAWYLTRRRA